MKGKVFLFLLILFFPFSYQLRAGEVHLSTPEEAFQSFTKTIQKLQKIFMSNFLKPKYADIDLETLKPLCSEKFYEYLKKNYDTRGKLLLKKGSSFKIEKKEATPNGQVWIYYWEINESSSKNTNKKKNKILFLQEAKKWKIKEMWKVCSRCKGQDGNCRDCNGTGWEKEKIISKSMFGPAHLTKVEKPQIDNSSHKSAMTTILALQSYQDYMQKKLQKDLETFLDKMVHQFFSREVVQKFEEAKTKRANQDIPETKMERKLLGSGQKGELFWYEEQKSVLYPGSRKPFIVKMRYYFKKYGKKWLLENTARICYSCKGSGKCTMCHGAKPAPKKCSWCKGSGKFRGKQCFMCKGKGKVVKKCWACKGTGVCGACKGKGVTMEMK